MKATKEIVDPENAMALDSNKSTLPDVDLRSDTVTKPTPEMRRAMAEAEVGDDVYGEDPTVNKLERRAAEIFGREAGLFVPSGSMGNLIAMRVHARPGQEIICEERSHIYNYEMGSISALAACVPRPVRGENALLSWPVIRQAIRPKSYHRAQTGMVALENTHNIAGGVVMPLELTNDICNNAHEAGLIVHLDGARVFNAALALGTNVQSLTEKFDSVMFCVSKGLGAPVGSLLVGSAQFVDQARIQRKLLGGGMRQAGILAAAGLIALEKSPARLHEDHRNAKFLAEGLAAMHGVRLDANQVRTNIIVFDVSESGMTSGEISAKLKLMGVLANGVNDAEMRMVTHQDVDRTGCERALEAMAHVLRGA